MRMATGGPRLLGLSLALGIAIGALPAGGPGTAAATPACVDGFDQVALTRQLLPEAVYASPTAGKAIVAGGARLGGGRTAARIQRFSNGTWTTISTRALGNDSGYTAMGGSWLKTWAVGYWQSKSRMSPLVVRRGSGGWTRRSVPSPGYSSVLTDVDARKASVAWAVGYRLDGPGSHRPLALKWNGKGWKVRTSGLGSGKRGLLAGVSDTSKGGTWAAGALTQGGSERPYVARMVSGTWRRRTLPSVGAGALAAIAVPAKDDGWAVGYRITGAGYRPLVLRWDGKRWSTVTPPELDGEGVLYEVDVAGGAVRVSGAASHATKPLLTPILATWEGDGWSVDRANAFFRDGLFTSVDTNRSTWTVGRDVWIGMAARACDEPAPTRAERRAVRQARRSDFSAASEPNTAPNHPEERRPEPLPGLTEVPRVQPAAAGDVRAVDKRAAAGLPRNARTYGAVIRDFDKDGRADIFLGGHTGEARLFMDRGASYERKGIAFGAGDRHGCAAADIDRSGLPDLYCSFGGARGLSTKINELWLDIGGPSPTRVTDVAGATEPFGRGRVAAFMDYDGGGGPDLVLGQQTNRVDGLPSLSRVYRWAAPDQLLLVKSPGLATAVGARAIDIGDFDRDGRVDLLLVSDDPRAKGNTASVKLYRNTAGGFKAVHHLRGIRSIGERDAELTRLDGDKRPDLIQLSADRIRVSLQREGRFKTVYERSLSKAVAVAVGDADGDGDKDIYILRQKNRSSVKDLILFNRGNGRSFKVVKAPSRAGGTADDVYAIDHDQNGLDDFLVLNGRGAGKGPLQLIAFYRS